MRIEKIRGHKRIQRRIMRWRNAYVNLDLSFIHEQKRVYTKIYVRPWSDLTMTNSVYSAPNSETKSLILSSLLDIYDAWKKQLDSMKVKYYLKVWLFEPRFLKSQVVCAVDDYIGFYDRAFELSEEKVELFTNQYGRLVERMDSYNWISHLDEDTIYDVDLKDDGNYTSKQEFIKYVSWLRRRLKKKHSVHKIENPEAEIKEVYIFKKGYVFVGESTKAPQNPQ